MLDFFSSQLQSCMSESFAHRQLRRGLDTFHIRLTMPSSLCFPQKSLFLSFGRLKLGVVRHPSCKHCLHSTLTCSSHRRLGVLEEGQWIMTPLAMVSLYCLHQAVMSSLYRHCIRYTYQRKEMPPSAYCEMNVTRTPSSEPSSNVKPFCPFLMTGIMPGWLFGLQSASLLWSGNHSK